ncbi:MBL fold metallo-hydrolase [Bradyrhizobium sp. ISRA435]|nr:MBL fold metallo-hydrolase [Bradyrhizobium sp. ISRA435]
MRIHHLNTGTMCPIGQRLVNGIGGLFRRGRMVCHCLLVESNDGLVLVDTGIGLDDIADPARLGRKWVRQTTPRLDPAETAVRQIKALGFSPNDVRHLLLTHLDRDHAGGRGGLSEGQGPRPPQGVRDGGDAADCAAARSLRHGAVAARAGLGAP